MNKTISIFALFLLISFTTFSQVTTSKIKGTVTDSKGEVLFGATVVVLHIPTGTTSGTIAQENGKYTVPNLRVGGPYKVTFSFVGYTTREVSNISLILGKTTNVNATLAEEGTTLDEIVISSSKGKIFNNY